MHMEKYMPKVLVVEDDLSIHELYRRALSGKVEMLHATTIEEAETLFAAHSDISAIIMDACVHGSKPTTQPLVTFFRKTFHGPMIAASREPHFRDLLVRAGCDYRSPKTDVPKKLCEILGIT